VSKQVEKSANKRYNQYHVKNPEENNGHYFRAAKSRRQLQDWKQIDKVLKNKDWKQLEQLED